MVYVDARIAVQGGWINPTVRAWMLATRPWSFPASFIAVLLAVGVASRCGEEWDFVGVAAAATGGTLVHAAANLINTYYDYTSGVDQKDDADDRTLVDGVLKPEDVMRMAQAFLAGALACIAYVVQQHAEVLPLAAVGIILAVGYTAAPIQLKHLGLGEATIFACFGPLLFAGASIAATGTVTAEVLLASAASGIATVAILHANNARDVDADRRAGAFTLAQTCGFGGNLFAYIVMIVGAFGLGALTIGAAVSAGETRQTMAETAQEVVENIVGDGSRGGGLLSVLMLQSHPMVEAAMGVPHAAMQGAARLSQFLAVILSDSNVSVEGIASRRLNDGDVSILFGLGGLAVCSHWGVRLLLRFSSKKLFFLPQQTAQFGLLFGAGLGLGVLPPRAAIRGLLAILFLLGGINNLVMWLHSRELVHSKLALVVQGIPAPASHAAALLTSLAQIAASSCFLLGFYEKPAAVALALFLVAVTPTVHNFWDANVPGDPEWGSQASSDKVEATPAEAASNGTKGKSKGKSKGRGRAGSRARTRRQSSGDDESESKSESEGGNSDDEAEAAPGAQSHSGGEGSSTVRGLDGAGPVPTFLQAFDNEFVHFWKNLGMLGGLLAFVAFA